MLEIYVNGLMVIICGNKLGSAANGRHKDGRISEIDLVANFMFYDICYEFIN